MTDKKIAEPYLGKPARCIAVLEKYDFSFKKKYGQNFLIDEDILENIVKSAGIGPEDFVLEIGPGIGTLTQYLAYYAKKVTAVELDKNLLPILADTLSSWDNVTVINADILKTDIRKIAEEENEGKPIKVVANLPYYITTPIILGLFESGAPIESITVMVQKEVADRMTEGPGSKEYGALSLAVQYYSDPEVSFIVPPSSFIPRPNVESAVVHLPIYQDPPVAVKSETLLFKLIRASFNQRRKKLTNGITSFAGFDYSKEEAERAVTEAGFDPKIRGEKLSLEDFAKIADELYKMRS